ncbi:flagellar protein FlgN [Aminipila butyrica]|uniref:Flagellar protein FlgN n=1 Tax=Aminipila butyrica TaxID=433296 RepID=A0A858BTX3_9FIRM|nr:flagellar export chaperone FlgN [Aminipila butyrica]QIB68390.1 flagellar protein FlgN [Aminipila butyrica]
MNKYMQIKDIMDDYISLMDELIRFEQDKLKAVENKNIEHLNSFLKAEQVYLLQLRGLDTKREAAMKAVGLEGLTYRQIINGIDPSEGSIRSELESSYEELSIKTNQFREIIQTLKTHIDLRLHTIETFMNKFGGQPSTPAELGIYDKIAQQQEGGSAAGRFKPTKA